MTYPLAKNHHGGLASQIILYLFLTLLAPAAWCASDPWPTTQFEVVDGSVFDGSTNQSWIAENFESADDSASTPLTPALKTLIEQYLSAVSNKLAAWGLPAPRLDIIERANGEQAYRVQYYEMNSVSVWGPKCSPTKRSTIHINANLLTQNGQITNKGYVDLAHELFHATEANSKFAQEACKSGIEHGKWITEGLAEAVGQDVAWEIIGHTKRNVGTASPIQRWGMRGYGLPLAIPYDKHSATEYQSSSFWRYLAELLYKREQSGGKKSSDLNKPGPELAANFALGATATSYKYIPVLFSKPIPGKGTKAELEWLESHLKNKSTFNSRLSHIYIDFVSVLSQYGRYRVKGKLPIAQREAIWRTNILDSRWPKADSEWWEGVFKTDSPGKEFVACEPLSINLSPGYAILNVDLDEKVATRCIELDVGDTGTPLRWNLEVVAESNTLLEQVRWGMAGGRQVSYSAATKPLKEASGNTAIWELTLDSNRKQYLLLANVAGEPWLTEPQAVQIHLTVEGTQGGLAISQPGNSTPAGTPEPLPGPAGAEQIRQQRSAQMGYQSLGAGSASWSYEDATEFCTRKNRASGGCNTDATLSFKTAVPPNMDLPNMAGPEAMQSQMAVLMGGGSPEMMRFMEFEDNTDGTAVELVIPGIDYGFKGTVQGVEIRVSGANESAGLRAWNRTAVSPTAPCVWGKPNGRVTIDEFTPHVLRGRYEANLISAELPPADFRGRCPKKSVVRQVSGTFVVASPWMDDDRQAEDMSWVQEDLETSLNEAMLPGTSIKMGDSEGEAPTISMSGAVVTETDFDRLEDQADEYSREDCECTCAEYQQGMKATREMMMGGSGLPEGEVMRLLTCTSYCLADVTALECELNMD